VWDDDDGDGDCDDAGKVHGSLARAGKVRGQTPKVAKQDKKKKPTGRAHKRMQYNRRFVTAGMLKGNSNFFPLSHSLCVCLYSSIQTVLMDHVILGSKQLFSMQYNCCFVTAGMLKRSPNFPFLFVCFLASTLHRWILLFLVVSNSSMCFAVVGFGKKRGPNSSEK
jgi:small subunit ribosomal protein S30e